VTLDLNMAALDVPPAPERAALPLDPWLARRMQCFGASDVPVLLVALGYREPSSLPSYLHADVKVTNRTGGRPRLIAQKAGIVAPRKRGEAADIGTARERDLLDAWTKLVEHGQAGPDVELLDPSTIAHASTLPAWTWPYPDRGRAPLAATLDAWCTDVFGADVVIECKCSVRPYDGLQAHHALQVQAQMAVMGAERGFVIEGAGWAAGWTDGSGPVRTYPVERCEQTIAEIRRACREGWALVEELRMRAEVDGG
jgi:hypothetical protein